MTRSFRVTAVPDARQAMQALANARVDLALVDIMLPGEDGLALSRKIREHGPTPIILVTAMSEDTDRIIGLELGADDYVVKPFNPRELLARIRAVLRRVSVAADDGGGAAGLQFRGLVARQRQAHPQCARRRAGALGSSEFDQRCLPRAAPACPEQGSTPSTSPMAASPTLTDRHRRARSAPAPAHRANRPSPPSSRRCAAAATSSRQR